MLKGPPSESGRFRKRKPASDTGNKIRPINFERAITVFDGDETFLRKLLKDFLKNAEGQIQNIRQGISDKNPEIVWREAHSVKGSAMNLTANNLSDLAFELEKIGKSGILEGSAEVLEKLETAFYCLKTYVKDKFEEPKKRGADHENPDCR